MSAKSKVAKEREKTAEARFFLYVGSPTSDKYPYSVCDSFVEPKTIARFKNTNDAGLFLIARRLYYVQTGE